MTIRVLIQNHSFGRRASTYALCVKVVTKSCAFRDVVMLLGFSKVCNPSPTGFIVNVCVRLPSVGRRNS